MEVGSGIYKIAFGEYNKSYVARAKRAVGTRFEEHIAHYHYRRLVYRWSIAQHTSDTGHKVHLEKL